MADIKLVAADDGERGPRGHRGHRGHRGPTGPTGPAGAPPPLPLIVAGSGIVPGMPFYIDANGVGQPAIADTLEHASAFSVAIGTVPQPVDDLIEYGLLIGIILAFTTWDERTGETGGLMTGASYYVSPTTPGGLTRIQPSGGNFVTRVGIALSPTNLFVNPGTPMPTLG